MAMDRNLMALDWISEELRQVVSMTSECLSKWLENPSDEAQLRFCLSYLHQASGSLKMVECFGVSVLTDELEQLCQSILQNRVAEISRATIVLQSGIKKLPEFVDIAIRAKSDDPITLLPLLNEIRAVRAHNLFSESPIFLPNLAQLEADKANHVQPKFDASVLSSAVIKLRKMYQFSLLSLLKKQDEAKALQYLSDATLRLQKISRGTASAQLWSIANKISCALSEGAMPPTESLLFAMRQLDRYLKALADYGPKILAEMPPRGLIKSLLFEVASNLKHYDFGDIVTTFSLESALPQITNDKDSAESGWPVLASVDRKRIVMGICEELASVRKKLMRPMAASASVKRRLMGALRRSADALSLLGEGDLAGSLECVNRNVQHHYNNVDFGFELKKVEAVIAQLASGERGISKPKPKPLIDKSVEDLNLCLSGIEQCKDSINEYIAGQFDPIKIESVPEVLQGVRDTLDRTGEAAIGRIIGACKRYIEDQLIGGQTGTVNWSELDLLANALTSAEYILESTSLSESELHRLEHSASESLRDLGYAIGSSSSDLIGADTTDDETTPSEVVEDIEEDRDEEIVEIFAEEVEEVLENLDKQFSRWCEDYANVEALTEFRRAFHTLKGSGRMVGADIIGRLAWSVEDYLNRIMDGALTPSKRTEQLIAAVRAILQPLVEDFVKRTNEVSEEVVNQFIDAAKALIADDEVTFDVLMNNEAPVSETQDETENDISVPEGAAERFDVELIAIFTTEAQAHLDYIKRFVDEARAAEPLDYVPTEELRRALHTLKGSAYMSELSILGDLVAPLERLVKSLIRHKVRVDAEFTELVSGVASTFKVLIPKVTRGEDVSDLVDKDALYAAIEALHDKWVEPLIGGVKGQFHSSNPEFIALISAPSMDALFDADSYMERWQETQDNSELDDLVASIKALYELSLNTDEKELSLFMSRLLEWLQSPTLDVSVGSTFSQMAAFLEALIDRINQLVASQNMSSLGEEQALLNGLIGEVDLAVDQPEATVPEMDEPLEHDQVEDARVDIAEPVQVDANDGEAKPSVDVEFDEDILALFAEEAEELLTILDEDIERWSSDTSDRKANEDIQRSLHTYKGSARMAGVTLAADAAHDLETLLISHYGKEVDSALVDKARQYFDYMRVAIDETRRWLGDKRYNLAQRYAELKAKVADQIEPAVDKDATAVAAVAAVPAVQTQSKAQEPREVHSGFDLTQPATNFEYTSRQEMVRVSSSLLDEMVNLAGETSISRSRVEQQVTDFVYTIDEMDNTINRLREQVRRLDLETEAQILFRQEQLAEQMEAEGFDPLEMDRYTTLQQLSRSLAESTSDLQDLKSTLADKTRDTETLLLQQSRINTDLQEGLMRSRMVLFSRIVPRLRTVVRNVSSELGKPVELELGNVEGELDRKMLNQMTAPLEHMLRNAIDHGIENQEERIAAGKPPRGTIKLFISREGAQVVIGISDDGRGIDAERVRQKAIDAGLLAKEQVLSEQELYQFIFRPGFSTRDDVSQISGRGIGLDVVAQEVRQMGGQLEVHSQPQQGSMFMVRLPFTLSVNRALMIQIGDDNFALPLSSVEGITRVTSGQLKKLYESDDLRLTVSDQEYEVRYLGELMGVSRAQHSYEYDDQIPLVLVKSDDRLFAMEVDSIIGSREIVVKGLGPQFASAPGLSGATILGDGTVVVILDLVAMLRTHLALGYERMAHEVIGAVDKTRVNPLVMVVDDSVTVRKVTSRLLKREGYDVITAKDGVDAVRQLQDVVPDVMLLDIEMPNMDGFEVARNVKNSVRLKGVPIIMITSRTGQKHRERAMEIGVEQYMGKPYQEDKLLSAIETHVSSNSEAAVSE